MPIIPAAKAEPPFRQLPVTALMEKPESQPSGTERSIGLSARLAHFSGIEVLHVTSRKCNTYVACNTFSIQVHLLGWYSFLP